MYETHVSQEQFTLQWAYWHLYHTGRAPNKEDLRSAWTLRMRFQQLDEKDRRRFSEYLQELKALHPLARAAYMSDATHFAGGDKLIRQLTYPHVPENYMRAAPSVRGHRSGGGGGGGGSGGGGGGLGCGVGGGDVRSYDDNSDNGSSSDEDGGGDHTAEPGVRTPRTHFLSIADTPSKAAVDEKNV